MRGILEHREKLDALIHHYAPEWPLDQIAIIDRNILRIAIFELASDNNVPVKVAISEAIILAKTFGTESTPRFINGVLGTLVSRETELHSILNTIRDQPSRLVERSPGNVPTSGHPTIASKPLNVIRPGPP